MSIRHSHKSPSIHRRELKIDGTSLNSRYPSLNPDATQPKPPRPHPGRGDGRH